MLQSKQSQRVGYDSATEQQPPQTAHSTRPNTQLSLQKYMSPHNALVTDSSKEKGNFYPLRISPKQLLLKHNGKNKRPSSKKDKLGRLSLCTISHNSSDKFILIIRLFLGFPGGSDSKESACNVEDLGSIPGLGCPGGGSGQEHNCRCRRHKRHGFNPCVRKIPWSTAWQPTPVSLPGESPRTEKPGGLQSTGSQRIRHE